ncbi:site-specific integrase [Pseudomonas sp. NPDC087346]|uniref:site-specific integrase n=1 Tax=Pseudomonas sp. NPDC087346 TaxID=3364438 RepID=UPI00381B5E1C
MPLLYPTLYATAFLRGSNLAVNTIANALTAIKVLYAWQEYYNLDMESRFRCAELIALHEIHALRDFVQIPLTPARQLAGNVTPIMQEVKLVSSESQYSRLSVIADYLDFLAGQLHPRTAVSSAAIQEMVAHIKANRPNPGGKSSPERHEIHVDDELLDRIAATLEPGSSSNPATDFSVQVRNALIFTVLRATAFRRSELLNLRIEDCDFNNNIIRVVRRPDSNGDPRNYQPVAKTLGRPVPVVPEIMEGIEEYIKNHRAKVRGANKHGYLFVTHKEGRFEGKPLSNSGFGKFMWQLTNSSVDYKGMHAHALRHHWNYTFSQIMDAKNVSPEREQKLRSKLLGWKETSNMAARYNRRHIEQEAGQAAIALQEKYLSKSKRGDDQ